MNSDDESPPTRRYLNRLSSSPGLESSLGQSNTLLVHKAAQYHLGGPQPEPADTRVSGSLKLSVKTNSSKGGGQGRGLDLQRFTQISSERDRASRRVSGKTKGQGDDQDKGNQHMYALNDSGMLTRSNNDQQLYNSD